MTDDKTIYKVMRDLTEGNPDVPILAGTGEIKLTEDEWDEKYGGTLNESPLHLDADQLAAITEGYVWTQAEDGEGQDWLMNGAFFGNTAAKGPLAFNVLAYWLSMKPWDTEKYYAGDIHASWGGDLENPDPEADDEDEAGED